MGLLKYGDQIYFTLFFIGAVLAISYALFGPRKPMKDAQSAAFAMKLEKSEASKQVRTMRAVWYGTLAFILAVCVILSWLTNR
jgi:hypothetical protein